MWYNRCDNKNELHETIFGSSEVFVCGQFSFVDLLVHKGGNMEKNFIKNIDQPFGWEPNEIIFNSNLSLKAKGLWLYMNAKPEGWFFASERIAEECSDGVTSIRAALKELADAGLLTWKKQGDGRIIYTLHSHTIKPVENPKSENLTLGTDPKLENPTVGKPHSGKTSPINNKEDNKERIIIKKEGAAGGKSASRPKRKDFDSDQEFEKAFYSYNRICLGSN